MITRIAIDAFKAFGKPVDVELAPFTVLIGANGSGKTTFLQAIDLLGRLTTGTISEYLTRQGWEYKDLPHLLAADRRFGVTVDLRLRHDYRWSLELETRRRPGIAHELVTLRHGHDEPIELARRDGREMRRLNVETHDDERVKQTLTSSWLSTVDLEGDAKRFPELVDVARWSRGIRGYFFLDPRLLRATSRKSEEVGPSGEQLAGFLGAQKAEVLDRITVRVRKHYPRLARLEVKRGRYGWTNLLVHEKWGLKEVAFNAQQVSDGLLRLVTVSALHELPKPPSVILLDEIENGLHPRLLGSFVEMMQDLVAKPSNTTQVIVTTHSPIALNFVRDPSQVLLVYRDGGSAMVQRLTDIEGVAKLREHFDLGELWYNVGEDRLLKRRAGARA